MPKTPSKSEVFVKINNCEAIPPDKIIVNLDVMALRDDMPDPNRAITIQLGEQVQRIDTDEKGKAKKP